MGLCNFFREIDAAAGASLKADVHKYSVNMCMLRKIKLQGMPVLKKIHN